MKLVGLIASVICDARRLAFFRMLLDSIRAQEQPCTGLFISIYIDPALLEPKEWGALFANLHNVHVLRQKRPKRQFVQYGELMDRLEQRFPQGVDFLLFSDDDDLWHFRRACAYMSTNAHTLEKVSAIAAKETTKVTSAAADAACTCLYGDSVQAMIDCGCVTFRFPSMKNEQQVIQYPVEYHEYAVRPFVLRDFLQQRVSLVKHNRFADMEFKYFVASYNASDQFMTINMVPPHWLYFYRRLDPTYPCASKPPVDTRAVTAHHLLTKDMVEKLIDHAAEMIVSGDVLRDTGNSQLEHFAQAYGMERCDEFSKMAQTALAQKHMQLCVDDPGWQRRVAAALPTVCNDKTSAYVWWMAARHVIVNDFIQRTDLDPDKWYACLSGSSSNIEGPFDTQQQARLAGQQLLEQRGDADFPLVNLCMALKRDVAATLIYALY